MGHDIPPGATYCAQGHPIALDAMQFANDGYGQGAPPGFGAPAGPPPGYGGHPAPGYGGPPPGYPAPPQGYGMEPHQGYHAFGNPPGYPPAMGGFGSPPPPAPYGAPGGAPQAFAPPAAEPVRECPPKMLRGFLVAYQLNANGDFWPLTGGRHVVGRAGAGEGIDIAIADPTISSKHAALTVDATSGVITVEDTGSTNGTFVNDEHLGFNGRRDLRDGDRIRFGGFNALVKIISRI